MKKSRYILTATFTFLATTAMGSTKVDPQPGQTDWEIANNIGLLLDEISQYTPTIISNADASGGVITISSPGIYCLSEELTNRIVIDADNVEIDLNGYGISLNSMVSGITIQTNHSQIVIHDGYIENANTSAGSGVSIEAGSGTIERGYIDKVKIFGFYQGMYLSKSTGSVKDVYIFNCSSTDAGAIGFYLSGPTNTIFENCVASKSGYAGWYLEAGSDYTIFRDCIAHTGSSGFNIASRYSSFFKCQSINNTNGFILSGTHNSFHKCIASKNQSKGFYISGNYNVFHKCFAINNSDGFSLDGSYILLEQCVASSNSYIGISDSSTSAYNLLDKCISINNAAYNYDINGTTRTFRCQSVGTSFSWKDNDSNTGWMVRG